MNELRNQCQFIGNLGKDPEFQYLPSGSAIIKFSIAVNEARKNDAGTWEDETTWVDLVAFGKTAENLAKRLKKGTKVEVQAKYAKSKYEDKEGQTRYSHNFVVRTFEVLFGGKTKEEMEDDPVSTDADEETYPF